MLGCGGALESSGSGRGIVGKLGSRTRKSTGLLSLQIAEYVLDDSSRDLDSRRKVAEVSVHSASSYEIMLPQNVNR